MVFYIGDVEVDLEWWGKFIQKYVQELLTFFHRIFGHTPDEIINEEENCDIFNF